MILIVTITVATILIMCIFQSFHSIFLYVLVRSFGCLSRSSNWHLTVATRATIIVRISQLWLAPGRWILLHQRDPPAQEVTPETDSNLSFLIFFCRYVYPVHRESKAVAGPKKVCLIQPVFRWKIVTKQTWNSLFLTCSCLSRSLVNADEQTQYCATAGPARQCHSTGNKTLPLFLALSYFTIIMLLGICPLQNQLLNSFSTQMHGQALSIIHTGWFYRTGKQLDGGKLCVSGCALPGTRNPSHIWPNQCAALVKWSDVDPSWYKTRQSDLASCCPLEL